MIKNPLNILFLLMFVFAAILSANTNKQLMQSAQIVINAFNGTDSRRGNEHLHLTPHLHEIFLHGQMLPDDIKNQLKAVGFNFSKEFVTRDRPNLSYHYDIGSIIRLHYNLIGDDAVSNVDTSPENGIPDYVEQMADVFIEVYSLEINELGYAVPPSDGNTQDNGGSNAYDIYIHNSLAYNYYGLVQGTGYGIQGPGGVIAIISYMEMRTEYSSFFSPNYQHGPTTELEAIKVTAAHEFFHAIQYGYDGYEEHWLLEATATWIEEIIYDDINDCYQYMPSWFNSPHTSLDKTGGTHWYGSYIFFKYIDEHLGGPETIRRIFEKGVETNSQNGDYSHQAISDGLEPVGSSFQDALNKMVIANRVMSSNPGVDAEMYSYEEAEAYPIDGPDTYTTINFAVGDTETVNSTNLQKYASQYMKVNTTTPVSIILTNTSGPQEDLNLHSIIEDYYGNFIIQTSSPLNIDPIGYSSIYLSIVSEESDGSDWNYQLSITNGEYDNKPPKPFELIAPRNNDTLITLDPTFTWFSSYDSDQGDVVTYFLEIGTHQDSLLVYYTGTDTIFNTEIQLTNFKNYFWRVKATDLVENITYNSEGMFKFSIENNPPSTFSIVSPTDSIINNTLDITFQWETAVDPDSNDVITYFIELGANIEYLETVYTGTDTTFQMNSLSDNTIYHWRVKAIDIAGNEIYNNNGVYTFMTQTTEQIENVTLSAPYPNPFPLFTPLIQNTRLKIVLNETQYIKVKVMNIFGEEVKSLFSGVLTVGFYDHLVWNGKMENGKKAPSGIYFILVEGDQFHTWQKVTLLR